MPPEGPEAKSFPGPEVLCTSCGIDSLLVNVIVSPGLTVRSLGSNCTFSIETSVPPPEPPSPPP
jgi:hypothetical protein